MNVCRFCAHVDRQSSALLLTPRFGGKEGRDSRCLLCHYRQAQLDTGVTTSKFEKNCWNRVKVFDFRGTIFHFSFTAISRHGLYLKTERQMKLFSRARLIYYLISCFITFFLFAHKYLLNRRLKPCRGKQANNPNSMNLTS